MPNDAICCNIGHFDTEIDVAWLESQVADGAATKDEIKAADIGAVDRYTFKDTGRSVIILAQSEDAQQGMSWLDTIKAGASPLILERQPISSTLQVTIEGQAVDRNRKTGFSYFQGSNSLSMHGQTLKKGTRIIVAYQSWQAAP